MVSKIEQDHSRFKQIVRGKIKRELKKYITQGELIGKQGKNIVSIPVPRIDLPRFRFDPRQMGGVGQGEGDVGTVLGPGDPQDGSGKAGDSPGQHLLKLHWKSWPKSWVKSSSFRTFSHAERKTSSPKKNDTRASASPVLNRFVISSALTKKRSSAKFLPARITMKIRSSCRSAKTAAIVPGN